MHHPLDELTYKFYMFLYFAWHVLQALTRYMLILYTQKVDCCRELLQRFSMQHAKSECSTHISFFTKFPLQNVKLSMQYIKFSMHTSKYYVQSNYCQPDNLFVSWIFLSSPLNGFACESFSH